MVTLHLTGWITEDGKLEVELPSGLKPGAADVTIQAEADEIGADVPFWTEEELAEMLAPGTPMTGEEIAESLLREDSGWRDKGITDAAEWVNQQKRLRRERNK